ncbi:lysozyme inhibitor LprI family protein [Neorhizobium sp. NCHU2750]|uniref:lysozyme inhibitor LprI family protein n=1 Tax=Neorhizobium sp. NCHU2750 TaxID=1825976 RepID=UPI000EB75F4A|nr:urease-associated protein [Neorhizobium sp. NCHU2750]
MLKLALWPMLCGCVVLTDAPAPDEEVRADCKAPDTQVEMTICAGQDLKDADKALNLQYKATRDILRRQDIAASAPGMKGGEEALMTAQRAWMIYRDAQCQSVGYKAQGGSMEPMLISTCQTDLTRKRTGELKALVDGMN